MGSTNMQGLEAAKLARQMSAVMAMMREVIACSRCAGARAVMRCQLRRHAAR